MKRYFIVLITCLLTIPVIHAQVQTASLINKQVTQYEKAEWNIQLTAAWENPYLQEDIALDLLLTTPSGKKITLPCYYESGESGNASVWKARFTPQEKGDYTYYFQLSKAGKVISTGKQASFSSLKAHKNGFLHTKNNWVLEFDNGNAFRGLGENICWESRDRDDSKFFKGLHENAKYNYEYMLPSLAKHGGNFFRTWICSWNLPIDWKKGFNNNRYTNSDEYYNPSATKALDRLVTLSDSLGLYIMLTLGQGAYDTKNGGYVTSSADFFVNEQAKAKYKNRLRYLVARWGYSTSIGAWEFFNEVDNVQFGNRNVPISAESITQWHDEMSTYLKSIDPYRHVVTTSISHRDVKGMNALPNIDINQKHIYKNTAIIPATIVNYETSFQKPYVIGEYGYEYDWNKDFSLFAEEMDSDFKRGLWYGLFAPTPILPMSWWWEFFDNRGTDAYIAKVKTIADDMLATGKGSFEQVTVKASDSLAKVYGVTCGNKTFVYAFNPTGEKKEITLDLPAQSSVGYSYKIYNCENGILSGNKKQKTTDNHLQLTNIILEPKSDAVLVISKTKK